MIKVLFILGLVVGLAACSDNIQSEITIKDKFVVDMETVQTNLGKMRAESREEYKGFIDPSFRVFLSFNMGELNFKQTCIISEHLWHNINEGQRFIVHFEDPYWVCSKLIRYLRGDIARQIKTTK